MKQKIYLVRMGDQTRLVRAPNRVQAIRHVVADTVTAEIPTQDDFAQALFDGVKIEDAGAETDTDTEEADPV